ncbi:hypothetical protein [Pseudactinotalea sp. HY158]|uniref:hypothetical protein n=1 Tax=Pseudactinotalea sp. HY158 TaxID=2654547 RepID=UPI00129C5097|nr:hypothetical protein [Pseudactinotalea sp. HY158]QGH70796.1 hypothetical protein GCE65_15825 [Pseudactinotalea sp. HY158]
MRAGPSTRSSRLSRRGRAVAAAGALALALAGCSLIGGEEPAPAAQPDRTVEVIDGPLAETAIDREQLPYPFAELPAFAPGWDDVPQYAAGVFMGLHDAGGVLEFTAVDAHGKELWRVQRPASCSGYVLAAQPPGEAGDPGSAGVPGATGDELPADEAVAILTDVGTTEDALAATTATGYNLLTGQVRWGPVQLPGPHQGPGPVFAGASPASAVGAGGPRQALDPFTGEVIADEAEEEGLEIVGVYDDVLVVARGGEIIATKATAGGPELWRLPVADLDPTGTLTGRVNALAGVPAVAGYAVLTRGEARTGAVVDVRTGEVIDTGIRDIAFDPAGDVLLTLDAQTLAGYSGGEPQWSRGVSEGMRISAAGGVLAYLRSDTSVEIVNTVTGEDAVAYPPEAPGFAVPALITESGAGIFALEAITLLGLPPAP